MATKAALAASDAEVLTSAIIRIAKFWNLSNAKLGAVLGLSQATASRLKAGTTLLDPASKSFEAGQFLLRLFRGLDALLGSDDEAAKSWLATRNLDLAARPIDLLDSIRGLLTVWDHVEAPRAPVPGRGLARTSPGGRWGAPYFCRHNSAVCTRGNGRQIKEFGRIGIDLQIEVKEPLQKGGKVTGLWSQEVAKTHQVQSHKLQLCLVLRHPRSPRNTIGPPLSGWIDSRGLGPGLPKFRSDENDIHSDHDRTGGSVTR